MLASPEMMTNKIKDFDEAFRELFRHSSTGVVIIDTAGKFLDVNDSFCEMVGYTPDELLRMDFVSVTYPQDLSKSLNKLHSLLNGETDHFLAEKRYVSKSGSLVWARSNITLIKDENGKAKACLGIVQNINDIKESEEALQEAIKYRDEFLRFASHELRTPMTSIKLNAQMLMRSLTQDVDLTMLQRKVEDLVNMTDFGINRINRLIDNMLDISQIQTGSLKLSLQEIDLEQVISSVLSTYTSDLIRAKIELKITSPQKFMISGDQIFLEKVFANLISNTIIYAQGSHLFIDLRPKENEVEISFRNDGPVIPSEDQLKIFHRFEKLQSVTNANGLGLGMFIVKTVIEAHQGTIILNPESIGAEFILRLPVISHD